MSTGPVLAFISGVGGGELVLIFIVFLMLFGAKKLPGIARSLGKSVSEFQRAAREVREEFLNADRELNKPATPAPDAPALPEASASPEGDGYGDGYHPDGEGYGSPETGGPAAEPPAGPIEPVREAAPEPVAETAVVTPPAVEPEGPEAAAAPAPAGDALAVQPPPEADAGNVEEASKS